MNLETKLTHNGVEITFDANTFKFRATIDGKTHRKPSLSAMKKFIDTYAKKVFVPVSIIVPSSYGSDEGRISGLDYRRVKMTGPARVRRRKWGRVATEIPIGVGERYGKPLVTSVAYRDTPATIEILKKLAAFEKAKERAEKRLEREEELIKRELSHFRIGEPNDF